MCGAREAGKLQGLPVWPRRGEVFTARQHEGGPGGLPGRTLTSGPSQKKPGPHMVLPEAERALGPRSVSV